MVKLGDNFIVVVVSICLKIWHLGLLHGRFPFWIFFLSGSFSPVCSANLGVVSGH